MFDYAERRGRLAKVLEREGVDALFLGLSSDLGGRRLLPARKRTDLSSASDVCGIRPSARSTGRARRRQ
jgi:hypothetical protein